MWNPKSYSLFELIVVTEILLPAQKICYNSKFVR
jgi:hypothetical protein